ncbi:hypothetical protein JKP88DRAFT_299695 [Tribonema minus]|uniref:Uncharacterized protein n=1 Tax=Tribonema minus TaxID=303371 RepID=A0A835ZAK2_9STRA|nr:hypothetical protein JKP88DRAFT_299695 [Tribonema minus]
MARAAAAAGAQTPGAPGAHTTLTPALKALRTSAAAPGGAADRMLRDAAIDEEAECDGYGRAAAGDEEGGARAAAAAGGAAAAQDAKGTEGARGAVNGEEEEAAQQQRRDLPWFRSLADDCLQGGSAAAAAFYADKAVTLSGGTAEDALRLARALAAEGAHRRAAHVLEAHGLLMLSADGGGGYSGAEACALAARCLAAAGRADDCLKLLERVMGEEDADAAAVVARARRDGGGGGGGGGGGAAGRVGRVHPLAALCCLRGSMYVEVDSRARAVVWLRAALAADYKCVDALHMLVSRHLLSAPQQEALLASLAFAPCDAALRDLYTSRLGAGALGGAAREAAFAALDRAGLGASTDVLAAKADYLYHRADYLYHRYQDKEALQLCRTVLARDLHNAAVMPAYAACLLEARDKAQLFFTANTLAEEAPGTALALHVLGCYHLLIARWEAAWRLFHKAAQQDSSSALYWVGMGNAAAAQDDSDRAVGAYRAATRACAGSYYPHLYMGMEYLRTNNLGLAGHFLDAARALCRPPPRAPPPLPPPPLAEEAPPPPEDEDEDVDPLLLNEMGVLAYRRRVLRELLPLLLPLVNACVGRRGDDARAAALFAAAAAGPARGAAWEPVLANLGHTLRRLGRHAEAARAFERALTLCPTAPSTLTALGFTRHLMGDLDAAVRGGRRLRPCVRAPAGVRVADGVGGWGVGAEARVQKDGAAVQRTTGCGMESGCYHQALSLRAQDPLASDLLARALEDSVSASMDTALDSIAGMRLDG